MSERPPINVHGYCLGGCRIGFASEAEEDAHFRMTGHATGWPMEDVWWPLATDDQVMGRVPPSTRAHGKRHG